MVFPQPSRSSSSLGGKASIRKVEYLAGGPSTPSRQGNVSQEPVDVQVKAIQDMAMYIDGRWRGRGYAPTRCQSARPQYLHSLTASHDVAIRGGEGTGGDKMPSGTGAAE
jgi:hypothetical protein